MGRPAIEQRNFIPGADLVVSTGRQHDCGRYRDAVEVLAVSQTLSMPRSFTRGNREILEVPSGPKPFGRAVEGPPRTTAMHASRKSDEGVVPLIRRRPTGRGLGEGRPETSENPNWPPMTETQDSELMVSG